mmetsp:Transcript_18013/g.24150  ORF Transcript_18013/g.24150 Transcript_18013/m.24150 type:complete len:226 (+) Transcript_18013:212-889(+)
MTAVLYEPSKQFIRALKPYHSDALTDTMNVFSVLGDGEVFFYFSMAFFATGNRRAFIFTSSTYTVTIYFLSWLKLQFHSSRPQFDDPTLGIVNGSVFCSGEFGNPSGHALCASGFTLTLLSFWQADHPEWFKKNPGKSLAIKVFIWTYICCVCACRIYLGRHSFDQVILGLAVGIYLTHFFTYCYKPFMFDRVCYPSKNEDLKVSAARAYKAFKISTLVYILLVV